MEIVFATANLHKIRELRDMCKAKLRKNFGLLTLTQFPQYLPPEETGATFSENAILKAEHAAKTLGLVALADDSGLVVPALNGSPGVFSRRYAGNDATDKENRTKLLAAMAGLDDAARHAYFECSLALAGPEGLIKCVSAKVEGAIVLEERGRNGFGYDPIFVKFDYDKTFAELDEGTKNRISHRHKAFEKLLPLLESL